MIVFGCNPGFVPAGRMTAVCASDGRWSPDPATTVCTCKNNQGVILDSQTILYTSSPVAMMGDGLSSCGHRCRVGLSS